MVKNIFDIVSSYLFRKTGYSLIATWRLERYELTVCLKNIFKKLQIDCVFDVGANRGQFHDFLRHEVGYRGHIFSFEPVHSLVEHLELCSQSDPLWHIYPFALGAEAGEAEINIMSSDDFSSFRIPDNAQTTEFFGTNAIKQTQTVSIKRFDDVAREIKEIYSFSNPYLKIDTQGFDLEVIKGAGKLVHNIAAIQCEVSVIPIYKDIPDYITTISTLKDIDFDLSGLFPVTRDAHLRVIEFDCVAINSRRHS